MLLIHSDESVYPDMSAADMGRLMADYGTFHGAVEAAGVFKGADRLQPTATATTVKVRDGKTLITDGPFAETKEQVGGGRSPTLRRRRSRHDRPARPHRRGRPLAVGLHLLPSRPEPGGSSRPHASHPRGPDDGGDRAGLSGRTGHARTAPRAGEAQDPDGEHPVSHSAGPPPSRASAVRLGRHLFDLQRGVLGVNRRGADPLGSLRRRHPTGGPSCASTTRCFARCHRRSSRAIGPSPWR